MTKLFIPSLIILVFSFGFHANAHEVKASSPSQAADYNLGADDAHYAIPGTEKPAEPEVKEQSWYEWGKANAYFVATFGISAAKWVISGVYGIVKDGLMAMGTKYAADILSSTAAALIAVYFDIGVAPAFVTKFFLDGLSRKVVGIVRNKMAEKGAELSSAAAARLESIAYGVLSAKMPVTNQ